jgi:hypothetical protein
MAGKDRMTLVFQHIPKTAGTTLSHVVARQFASHEIFHVRDPNQPKAPRYSVACGSVEQFIALPESQRARFRCVLGHMHFGIHRYVPGPAKYLTILRDPVQRVLSQHDQYTRMVNSRELEARPLTLEQFISGKPAVADNHQTRFLCGCRALNGWEYEEHSEQENLDRAKQHLREHCIVVGTVQRFDETMVVLGERMGWQDVRYVRYNIGTRRAWQAHPDPATLRAIFDANALDRELHAFANALLDEAIAQIGTAFAERLAIYRASTDLPRPLGQRLRGFVGRVLRGRRLGGRRKDAPSQAVRADA